MINISTVLTDNFERLFLLVSFSLMLFLTLKPSFILEKRLFKKGHNKLTREIDSIKKKNLGGWILLAAGLGLYLEMVIIRLHASYFPLFGFYKNISLISCFLGLGIGYTQGKKKPLILGLTPLLLTIQIIFIDTLGNTPIRYLFLNPIPERGTMGLGNATFFWQLAVSLLFLALVFAFNALCFVPLGHLAAYLMSKQKSLLAYGWNLIGSLAGVLLFTIVSFFWAPPSVWLIMAAFPMVLFFRNNIWGITITFFSTALILIFFIFPIRLTSYNVYSPYQILTVYQEKNKPLYLMANHTYFQRFLDLREKNLAESEWRQEAAGYYNFPFLLKPQPGEVLVVGSGTGNDVAAALRNGAGHVDAVEIDPAIVKLGFELHPEAPYHSDKVTVFTTDARKYIKNTEKKYDLIVYGLLDSHTLLSGKSSVRLDSFVYTVEAFEEARKKLKQDGLISLTFAVNNELFGKKLYLMFEEAFDGQPPLVFEAERMTVIAGENLEKLEIEPPSGFKEVSGLYADRRLKVDKSFDDWPFFYMPFRRFPRSVIFLVYVLLGISVVYIKKLIPVSKKGFSKPAFFLGAGFMLIEAKNITELALYYGSTWLVTGIAVVSILIMAFLANWLILKIKKPNLAAVFLLLGLSLLLGVGLKKYIFFRQLDNFFQILMTTILALPIFFSGLAFSVVLKKSDSVAKVMSANLLGAVLGGFLEYNSMYFGFQFLSFLAVVLYALALTTSIGWRFPGRQGKR